MAEGIHTLGRKGSSVSFPEDRSVSRKHAEIRVGPVPGNDPTEQPIWVKDVGSKLKTCVNGSETGETHKEISLKEGDEVKVGTTNSIMRVRFQALRFCATQLTAEEKAELKALSKKCGGAVSRKWDAAKCTHLVTLANTSSVTEKLVLALLGLRPVVHVGWLKDLAAGGTAKPLRPVPETEAFGPVVTRSRRQGPFRVRHTADRRTHLSGDFFAILHKDELVETIVEAAGGALCRAYAMSDDDFAGQDWQEWSAGRQSHFVQAGPEVSLSAKAKGVLASRGEVLEDVGMEATDKTQLTEAVVYLQSLVNVREAMRASSSSIAPMAVNTSSEAWGPSQSLAASQDEARGAERRGGGIAGAGGNAAGKAASSATAAAVADDDQIGDGADDAEGVPVAGPTPGGDDDDDGDGGGGGRGSGGGDSGGGSGGGRTAKRKRGAQPPRRGRGEEDDARGAGAGGASVEDHDKQQDEEEEEEASLERRGRGSQQRSSVPAPAPGGWMTAHNASSSQKDKRPRGGRVRVAGGVGGDTEGEVEEDENGEERARLATPADPAITEMCRLVAKAVSRSAPMGYSRSSSARPVGGRRGPAVPNFKRFKKNTIMFGGEQVAAYVPLAALRSTLPKESERELALAEEQQQLEAEEADADRLFTQNDNARGAARARAPRGRTKRR
ncbi:nibrin [Ectocarpus siliculosus]|uniref:Nibrin n=1 Tax=Ectocarpus siliculosus TaxID=2880 RepID=D8LKB3_ECTSI|nr:nibrin [Ectocarpus siliculosus]|eukprot:CBN76058.1 nibrin [Ectocarpus siliculosus]